MDRLHPVLTIAITAAMACTISACGNPVDTKTPFAPPAGQAREFFWTQVVDMNVKAPAMGMDDTTTQTTKMNLLANPGEAGADGSVDVEVTFDYYAGETTGGANSAMGGMDQNASNKAVAKAMMGKSFTANVDAGGRVLSLSGVGALKDSVLAELNEIDYPDEAAAAIKTIIEETTNQQFGEAGMREMTESFILPRSLESLDAGVTWTRDSKMDFGMMPTNVIYTYTVTERSETAVSVEEASTFELDPYAKSLVDMVKLNPMVASLGEPTLSLNGTGTGSYTIDSTSGWVSAYDGTITLTGKLEIGPMNADIKITATQDFTSNFQ
jgi:hypothetical protein